MGGFTSGYSGSALYNSQGDAVLEGDILYYVIGGTFSLVGRYNVITATSLESISVSDEGFILHRNRAPNGPNGVVFEHEIL